MRRQTARQIFGRSHHDLQTSCLNTFKLFSYTSLLVLLFLLGMGEAVLQPEAVWCSYVYSGFFISFVIIRIACILIIAFLALGALVYKFPSENVSIRSEDTFDLNSYGSS